MKTMLFNPYSGKPRHPLDIASDPEGKLMVDPDEPLLAAPMQTGAAADDARDAALWREHMGKLDALVTYCPTCCQGSCASKDMTRDQIIFECGKTVGRSIPAAKPAEPTLPTQGEQA